MMHHDTQNWVVAQHQRCTTNAHVLELLILDNYILWVVLPNGNSNFKSCPLTCWICTSLQLSEYTKSRSIKPLQLLAGNLLKDRLFQTGTVASTILTVTILTDLLPAASFSGNYALCTLSRYKIVFGLSEAEISEQLSELHCQSYRNSTSMTDHCRVEYRQFQL